MADRFIVDCNAAHLNAESLTRIKRLALEAGLPAAECGKPYGTFLGINHTRASLVLDTDNLSKVDGNARLHQVANKLEGSPIDEAIKQLPGAQGHGMVATTLDVVRRSRGR